MPSAIHFFFRTDQLYPWLYFFLMSLLALALMILPWPLLALNPIFPNLCLIVMFFWVLVRPELTRYSVFFGIGLLQDLAFNLPLGMNALLNIGLLLLLQQLRPYIFAKSIYWILLAFTLVMLAHSLCLMFLGWAFGLHMGMGLVMGRVIFTAAAFVLISIPLLWGLRVVVNLSHSG